MLWLASLFFPTLTLVIEAARPALRGLAAAAAAISLFGVYCKVLFYYHGSHSS